MRGGVQGRWPPTPWADCAPTRIPCPRGPAGSHRLRWEKVGVGLEGQAWRYVTHRPDEVPELLPVGLDLLLQDVVLGDLFLQLRHARPEPALADLLLQESWPLSAAAGLGRRPSLVLPASAYGGVELVVWAEGGRASWVASGIGNQLTLGDKLFSSGPGRGLSIFMTTAPDSYWSPEHRAQPLKHPPTLPCLLTSLASAPPA